MIVDGNKSTRQPYKTTVYNHGRRIDLANQLDDDVYDDDGGESKNLINYRYYFSFYPEAAKNLCTHNSQS